MTHDDPDPDAIASGMGLAHPFQQRLDLEATLAYGGIVGRAEDKAMPLLLTIQMHHRDQLDPEDYDVLALVDGQPRPSSVVLHQEINPTVVIDHRCAVLSEITGVQFVDFHTGCGSTSTILISYLRAAGLAPD